jgi:hypothetical protein
MRTKANEDKKRPPAVPTNQANMYFAQRQRQRKQLSYIRQPASPFFSPSLFVYTRVPKSRVCHCSRRIHKNTSLSLSLEILIHQALVCRHSLTRSPTRPPESFVSSFAAAGAAPPTPVMFLSRFRSRSLREKMYMPRINIARNRRRAKKNEKSGNFSV